MPGEDYQSWSTTATLNGNSDSLINWLEGQTRASVNNSSRSEMAAHAKNRNLLNGSIVTGGTASAQTFTSGVTYTAVPTGMQVMLKIGTSLTSVAGTATTLNMDGIGAVNVKNQRDENVEDGLIAGTYAHFIYNGTNWIWLEAEFHSIVNNIVINQITITTIAAGGAGPVAMVDFTNLDTTEFQRYEIIVSGFMPETLDAFLTVNVSTDNGATFITDASTYQAIEIYGYQLSTGSLGDVHALTWTQNNSYLAVSWPIRDQTAAFPSNIKLTLFGFEPAISPVIQYENSWYQFNDNFSTKSDGNGYGITVTGANAIRLWCSAGNIAKATITVVGYKIG